MTAHWAMQYLGRPWVSGGQGPHDFDCWGLVRWVQREHFGRELPLVVVDATCKAEILAAFDGHAEYARWQLVEKPAEGDCVVTMTAPDEPSHVGVYLEIDGGRILQCVTGSGVVAPSLRATRRSIGQHLQFWRWKEA